MAQSGMFQATLSRATIAQAFSRAARVSLLGLLIPGAATALAASTGHPLPAMARTLLGAVPVLAFAASGAKAARTLDEECKTRASLALGFATTGLLVTPAYASLVGLTGHEPVHVVVAVTELSFAVGFAAPAIATFRRFGPHRRRTPTEYFGAAGCGALAGAIGGLILLVPFFIAATHHQPAIPYVMDALAVGSFLASIILPYRLIGMAFDTHV
jgi:hypothetical protein